MGEKKEFIKEKIVKKSGAGKGFRNFVKIVVGAMLFGVIAAGVFALSVPYTQQLLGKAEETTQPETVTIPRDEPETLQTVIQSEEDKETESLPEDGEIINDMTEEESTEPVEDIVQEVIEGYNYSVDDLSNMWDSVAALCDQLDRSVVAVRTYATDKDIFDNERSREGEYSGIIIAETETDMIILTKAAAAESEDDLSVVFFDNRTFKAELLGKDSMTGLAVVGVSLEELDEDLLAQIIPVTLGNSYQVSRGDMLLYLGSPKGVVHSTSYSWVSYVEADMNVVDGTERHIYTNCGCSSALGTWVMDAQGRLVGWAAETAQDESAEDGGTGAAAYGGSGDVSLVIGVSEYKSILERMINAGKYAYIGLNLVKLPDNEYTSESPQGLYVVEVAKESPAYSAGIMAGDILMELGNADMRTPGSYTKLLEGLTEGMEIEAVVYRESIGDYKEISYTITVGER